MMPLAQRFLAEVREPGACCGVAAARCFPDAPKLQAALAEYRADWADIITWKSASNLDAFAQHLASVHGLSEVAKPASPALAIAAVKGVQTFAIFDGARYWVMGPRGIRPCHPRYILRNFEVA